MFYKIGVILYAFVYGRRKDFIQGKHLWKWIFPNVFSGGQAKVVKFVFYHSKLRKQPFLLISSNSYPPSDTHACV